MLAAQGKECEKHTCIRLVLRYSPALDASANHDSVLGISSLLMAFMSGTADAARQSTAYGKLAFGCHSRCRCQSAALHLTAAHSAEPSLLLRFMQCAGAAAVSTCIATCNTVNQTG